MLPAKQPIILQQQQPMPPHMLHRQSRPNSHHAASIRVPFGVQGVIPPECLHPNQLFNLGQQKVAPVIIQRNSFSVSRHPSLGRPAQTVNKPVPNSLKIIPVGPAQQSVQQRPPSLNKRPVPQQIQLLQQQQSYQQASGLSTPIRRLDNLLDDEKVSPKSPSRNPPQQHPQTVAWQNVRPGAFKRDPRQN